MLWMSSNLRRFHTDNVVVWGFLVFLLFCFVIDFVLGFLFVFFSRMHWFYMKERICLLIIQNVTVHGFCGFYRLPLKTGNT